MNQQRARRFKSAKEREAVSGRAAAGLLLLLLMSRHRRRHCSEGGVLGGLIQAVNPQAAYPTAA